MIAAGIQKMIKPTMIWKWTAISLLLVLISSPIPLAQATTCGSLTNPCKVFDIGWTGKSIPCNENKKCPTGTLDRDKEYPLTPFEGEFQQCVSDRCTIPATRTEKCSGEYPLGNSYARCSPTQMLYITQKMDVPTADFYASSTRGGKATLATYHVTSIESRSSATYPCMVHVMYWSLKPDGSDDILSSEGTFQCAGTASYKCEEDTNCAKQYQCQNNIDNKLNTIANQIGPQLSTSNLFNNLITGGAIWSRPVKKSELMNMFRKKYPGVSLNGVTGKVTFSPISLSYNLNQYLCESEDSTRAIAKCPAAASTGSTPTGGVVMNLITGKAALPPPVCVAASSPLPYNLKMEQGLLGYMQQYLSNTIGYDSKGNPVALRWQQNRIVREIQVIYAGDTHTVINTFLLENNRRAIIYIYPPSNSLYLYDNEDGSKHYLILDATFKTTNPRSVDLGTFTSTLANTPYATAFWNEVGKRY